MDSETVTNTTKLAYSFPRAKSSDYGKVVDWKKEKRKRQVSSAQRFRNSVISASDVELADSKKNVATLQAENAMLQLKQSRLQAEMNEMMLFYEEDKKVKEDEILGLKRKLYAENIDREKTVKEQHKCYREEIQRYKTLLERMKSEDYDSKTKILRAIQCYIETKEEKEIKIKSLEQSNRSLAEKCVKEKEDMERKFILESRQQKTGGKQMESEWVKNSDEFLIHMPFHLKCMTTEMKTQIEIIENMNKILRKTKLERDKTFSEIDNYKRNIVDLTADKKQLVHEKEKLRTRVKTLNRELHSLKKEFQQDELTMSGKMDALRKATDDKINFMECAVREKDRKMNALQMQAQAILDERSLVEKFLVDTLLEAKSKNTAHIKEVRPGSPHLNSADGLSSSQKELLLRKLLSMI